MTRALSLLVCLVLGASNAFAAKITIRNADAAGVGLNDPTPAAPVGGNGGTTLGRQRLNVYLAAAETWSRYLDSNVEIVVQARFSPIANGCDDEGAVLGQARALRWERDFANVPEPNTWYPVALANKLAGVDLRPSEDDIFAHFNADVDRQDCLGDRDWYYGLDGKHGDDEDLFVVVLHEIAHGLGFSSVIDLTTGRFDQGLPSIYAKHMLDRETGLRWHQMSNLQRATSATNSGDVVWVGENVRVNAPYVLNRQGILTVSSPSAVAGDYEWGAPAFGPDPQRGFSGRLVAATDAADGETPSTTDGCSALSNGDAIRGNIALVDRGGCFFVDKVRNAQNAGATGVVIVDNINQCLPQPLGTSGDTSDIAIPAVSVFMADGNRFKQQLATGVNLFMRTDPTRLAGTSGEGYLRLYAPCELEQGSSIHHWDTRATPNLLMEPSVNSDLLHGLDLTVQQLLDLGWTQMPRSGRTGARRRN